MYRRLIRYAICLWNKAKTRYFCILPPILVSALIILNTGCAPKPRFHSASRRAVVDKSDYKVGYSWTGYASYYGKKFHKKKTSNGETFNMHGISAAHKTLPFGTILEVENLKNGRKVRVRINDRGPFIAGREIDLSYGAAKKIDMLVDGVVQVKMTIIHMGDK